ncbi:membrane protein insertion efficiency factor YidD [Patescibacteria group bacterium]|nr:membrane protein insertion efficiency factor YidD [Patescibacteria group bacterium]
MKKLILTFLKFYKKVLSPKNFRLSTCKFIPSCSEYTYEAVEKHGLRGLFKGFWRVLRCNPFSHGGYDPVK